VSIELELELERAALDDLEPLLAIERASYTNPWSAASLRETLASPERFHALVLRVAGGRGAVDRGVRGYCIFQLVADEMHLHNLAVAEGARRQGLARRLLVRAFELAQAAGARCVLLEVRESNAAARALYGSLGFSELGVRRGYYVEPREDAVLLRKPLP
jgi:ribosomal-protein-alanine N-acetyltransferase